MKEKTEIVSLDFQALQGVGRVSFLQGEPSKQAASHELVGSTATNEECSEREKGDALTTRKKY
ncbi:hypothetical protein EYF80_015203 [Liparis tanakae]|uniref:Uncharacterized protein n=1 Tax=Liparis tanakae TaxID=230148 RepID=A0A4Z2I9F9_9TELE|nr:hypothetical protein EYF80_015203 [Liparis tanakae]